MSINTSPFDSIDQISSLVDSFEDCSLPHNEWNHRAHLSVALWYLCHHTEVHATEKIISGIQRYNHANGIHTTKTTGYHETLTLFWITIARHYVVECNCETSLLQRTNDFVRVYGDQRNLFLEYYSRDRLFSWRARQTWVEPDLKRIDQKDVRHSAGFVLCA